MTLKESNQYPFIVIEGLDGVGKSTQVRYLAEALNAAVIQCPPFIEDPLRPGCDLRERMDKASLSRRREYYRMSNFIASEQIRLMLKHQPVVVDRYWTSTAAFSAMDKSPPRWEAIGMYPEGFLEPDMVILLTVDETNRSLRIGGRGLAMTSEEKRLENQDDQRSSVLELYRMFDPIEIDTSDLSPDEVLEEILHWLNEASLLDWLGEAHK